ncbi:MAG: hypothetical protein AB7S38_29145 [Vulcanimicrobiota bacterium]
MRDDQREEIEGRTVDLILAVRREYLAGGANPLKHWDQLQDRIRVAARTSTSVAEWVTTLSRSLGLAAPSNSRSLAISKLAETVGHVCTPDEWLDLVEREHSYLIAMGRLRVQEAKERPQELTDTEALEEGLGGPNEAATV